MKKIFKKLSVMFTALLTLSLGTVPSNVNEVRAAGNTYTKVTSALTDWSGQYLAVYEDGTNGYVFNGQDAVNGYVSATINNNTIVDTTDVDYSDYLLTVSPMSGGYSVKFGEQYIGGKSNNNTIVFSESEILNTFSVNDSDDLIDLISNTTYLRFNKASNQMRFRYYKTRSQESVYLYKLSSTKELTVEEKIAKEETMASLAFDYDVSFDTKTSLVWTLVTDINQFEIGDQVIIAAANDDYAMSTTQNANNRGQAAITKNEKNITFNDDTQIFTLKEGRLEDTYSFYDSASEGYIYAASSSSNYLKTSSSLSDDSSFKITIDSSASNGAAVVVAQGSNSRNSLRYNYQSNLFSCYMSGQQDVCFYRLAEKTIRENIVPESFDNVSILFGAQVETSLFNGKVPTEAGVYMIPTATLTTTNSTISELVATGKFAGQTYSYKENINPITIDEKDYYYVYSILNVISLENEELTDSDIQTRLGTSVTAAVYFVVDGQTVVLTQKSYSVKEMAKHYLDDQSELGIADENTLTALEALYGYAA